MCRELFESLLKGFLLHVRWEVGSDNPIDKVNRQS